MTPSQESSPPHGAEVSHRILVIDDNAAIHEDFRKILTRTATSSDDLAQAEATLFGEPLISTESITFEIDSAYQGKEGLDLVRQALAQGRPYALAFVDVRMPPGWDGVETISHIWRSYPELQVVICTAYSDYSWNQIVRQLGTTDNLVILKKPFDNVEVLQLAHALTKKWLLAQKVKCRLEDLDRMVQQRTRDLQEANVKLRLEIREREQIENALRLSEERFSKAFRASPIPMTIQLLADEKFVDFNESFLQMTGHDAASIRGRTAHELPLFAQPSEPERLIQLLRSNEPVRQQECQLLTKTGQVRVALISMELLPLGEQPHVLFIAQDITEKISLEQQLRQAQKMEAIGQLAAGVAHDFNNIMTVIQGHAGLLLANNRLERRIADSLEQISAAAERAASLTRQLLAFSRKQIIQRRVLDVNDTLQGFSPMLRPVLGEDISLEWQLAPGLPPVFADAGCLEQVLVNLALNARDAMPEGGLLRIATTEIAIDPASCAANTEQKPGRYVAVTVEDNGDGMKSEVLSRIFEPFFTTKDVGKGTGLGLATVYGILKQHGGWIEAASEIGRGSQFRFFLPISPIPSLAPAGADPANLASNTSAQKVMLLVEDEKSVRELIAQILRTEGWTVHSAASGAEALALWHQLGGRFDLLLTDVVMPGGISGLALAETLLAHCPRLPVIYMTGYSLDLANEGLSSRKRSVVFLRKPFTPAQLLGAIEACRK